MASVYLEAPSWAQCIHLHKLSPPHSRRNYGVPPSHGSRLEDVGNLRVDGWIVAGPWGKGTISRIRVVVVLADPNGIVFAREKLRQPLIDDNVLVSSNGELAGTVEQPLVFFRQHHRNSSFTQSPCPKLMHSEPQDTHSEEERVFITTGIANC